MEKEKQKTEKEWYLFKQEYHYFSKFFETKLDQSSCKAFSLGYYHVAYYKDEENSFILKRFQLERNYLEMFKKYLNSIVKFYCSQKKFSKTNYMIPIYSYSCDANNIYYVILSLKNQSFKDNLEMFNELEILSIIRNIARLYYYLSFEKEMIDFMYKAGVSLIDEKTMCYYRKFWEDYEIRLPTYKLKFDFLNFKPIKEKILLNKNDISYENLHLDDLNSFIHLFPVMNNNPGLITKNFIYRLDHDNNITWIKIFHNPLFLQNIGDKIDWDYWKITEADKKILKNLSEKKTLITKQKSKKFLIGKDGSTKEKSPRIKSKKSTILINESSKQSFERSISNKDLEEKEGLLRHANEMLQKKKKLKKEEIDFIYGWIRFKFFELTKRKPLEKEGGYIKIYEKYEKKMDIKNLIIDNKILDSNDFSFLIS